MILIFSTNTNRETVAYRSFQFLEFEVRGVRKVTTGITGLWQPSVHSDTTSPTQPSTSECYVTSLYVLCYSFDLLCNVVIMLCSTLLPSLAFRRKALCKSALRAGAFPEEPSRSDTINIHSIIQCKSQQQLLQHHH